MQIAENTVLIASHSITIQNGTPYVLIPKVCRDDLTANTQIEFHGLPDSTDIIMRIVNKKGG